MQMWGRFFFLWFKFVFNFPIVRLCPSFRFTTHPEFFFRKNKLPTFVPNFSSRETPAKNPSTIDTAHCIHLFFLFAAISAILLSVPKPIFFFIIIIISWMKFPCPVNTCFQFSIDQEKPKQDEDDLKNDFTFSSWPFNVHLE